MLYLKIRDRLHLNIRGAQLTRKLKFVSKHRKIWGFALGDSFGCHHTSSSNFLTGCKPPQNRKA